MRWNDPNNTLGLMLLAQKYKLLSLAFSIDSTKEMGRNSLHLQKAASNKMPKDIISNQFFAKLSVMCIHDTGSSLS